MIVNDFDKPYIAMVFSSCHFLIDTASDSRLGSTALLPVLFNDRLVYSLFHLTSFDEINNYNVLKTSFQLTSIEED